MKEKEYQNSKLIFNEKGIFLGNMPIILIAEKKIIQKSIQRLCKDLKPKLVLEIGFGLGYTADEFQKNNLDKHIIVESHPEIYKRALEWAKDKNVEIIYDFIQNVNLEEEFDVIYDDRKEFVYSNFDFLNKFKYKHYVPFLEKYATEEEKEIIGKIIGQG